MIVYVCPSIDGLEIVWVTQIVARDRTVKLKKKDREELSDSSFCKIEWVGDLPVFVQAFPI